MELLSITLHPLLGSSWSLSPCPSVKEMNVWMNDTHSSRCHSTTTGQSHKFSTSVSYTPGSPLSPFSPFSPCAASLPSLPSLPGWPGVPWAPGVPGIPGWPVHRVAGILLSSSWLERWTWRRSKECSRGSRRGEVIAVTQLKHRTRRNKVSLSWRRNTQSKQAARRVMTVIKLKMLE